MSNANTKFQVFVLLTSLIPEAILESTLIPLYPFMVRYLLPGEPESTIGVYTGYLGSAFYLPLFIMNLVWGALSDRYGRKPILMMGLIVLLITSILLGFSQTYGLTLACRFAAGLFGANSTVAKGMIGDIARDGRSRAWGYAMYGSVYGLSGMLGPLIGGLLSNPADLYPQWFSKEGIFGRLPYLLTCLVGTFLSVLGLFVTAFYLKENNQSYDEIEDIDSSLDISLDSLQRTRSNGAQVTIPRLNQSRVQIIDAAGPSSAPEVLYESTYDEEMNGVSLRKKETHNHDNLEEEIEMIPDDNDTVPKFNFIAWNTLGPIFLYCIIAYVNMTYMTTLPLFFSASKSLGGMEWNSRDTALSFTILSASKLISQLFFFDPLFAIVKSSKLIYTYSMAAYIPIHLIIPGFAILPTNLQVLGVLLSMVILGACEAFGYLSIMLVITESQLPEHLGTAHGLASTLAALARTISPSIGGSMWEYGVALHWSWLVFFFSACTALIGVISSS
ncbi:major facilitator superfamily domain-containing protein [Globomyces pollinis-pini]|nr:major facilitator superfamily domain-containing protein [Globomyces pollinis-pini]